MLHVPEHARSRGWFSRALSRFASRAPYDVPEKKASRACPLIALESLHQPVWSPRDYASFAREGFMQNAIVFRAVRMVAEAAASVPLLLYEGDVEIEAHPLLDLLARPNPVATGPDLLEAWYGYLLVSGNTYLEAVALGGEIRELHALRPDRMKVVPGPDGWPEAYDYSTAGESVRFAGEVAAGVRPILHVKLFHPGNDHYGLSPLEAAATAIDIHNTASRWNKALLDNSARPSGALVYTARDGNLSPEQFERLKSELEAGFQGAAHAGRPLLLEGGLDWKSMSLSPKDMDFIEAKHVAAREIALALGVPPMLLGIPGDNTYSNLQEATRSFWRQTVLPLVDRTAKAFSAWLAPAWGERLELRADLDRIEALSPEREALWSRLEKTSFLTRDEKRAAIGYAPLGEIPVARPVSLKYRPDQARDDDGRWVDEGGGDISADNDDDSASYTSVQSGENDRYRVRLDEEVPFGGHALRDHSDKTDAYLIAALEAQRHRFLTFTIAKIAEGSFLSREAANDFTNRVLEANATQVDLVVSGALQEAWLSKRFGYVTGKEAFREDAYSPAYIRDTYEVGVLIRYDARRDRGYSVETAYPFNRRSK